MRVLLAFLATLILVLVGAAPASAYGSVTWSTLCGGYAGKSWYTSSTGISHAHTQASDNQPVRVAVRFYQGRGTIRDSNGYVYESSTIAAYGGWHSSRTTGICPFVNKST